jgi:hypothetical protein
MGLSPRCRSRSEEEKATSSHGKWLAWEEPRAVGDLVHVEKFFARTWRRLQGQNQLPKVIGGVRFQDGIEVTEAPSNHAA